MRRAFVLGLVALAACSQGRSALQGAQPAATAPAGPAVRAAQPAPGAPATAPSGPAAPATPPAAVVPGASAAPSTGACPPPPARAVPEATRPRYAVRLDVRPAEGVASGEVRVRFVPDLGIDHLVFRLWPNGPRTASAGARAEVGGVAVGGRPAPSRLTDPTTLVVDLPDPVAAGTAVEASVGFVLRLPGEVNDRIFRSGDALRLGSFFPILPWEPGVGWALEPPARGFAEAQTAPAADVELALTLPAGLGALTTGSPGPDGRIRAEGVRDLGVSVGRFRTATAVVVAPGPVRVTVGVAEGLGEDPGAHLAKVVGVLAALARRYGPYPWPELTVAVTPGLHGGIEYPAHVMLGPGRLGRTTTHELAHQWFYGLVGSDQARDPWLDEGLASWAEARVEGTLPAFLARTVPVVARGRAGAPMSWWDGHLDAYYRGVYVQTVQALAAAGPPDLVDCALASYVARNAWRLARPADLLAAVDAVLPAARPVLARFGLTG